jgi:hypothetical protein
MAKAVAVGTATVVELLMHGVVDVIAAAAAVAENLVLS